MVRDNAKQPAMWGAALSVAVCALMGYTAYKNRDEATGIKVVSARAKRALRREMRSKIRAAARGKKKAAASKTHA